MPKALRHSNLGNQLLRFNSVLLFPQALTHHGLLPALEMLLVSIGLLSSSRIIEKSIQVHAIMGYTDVFVIGNLLYP